MMGIENLDSVFRPQSIAVIGASDRPGSIGSALMRNLRPFGANNKILPVNPKHGSVMGLPAAADIGEVEKPVDLALVCIPLGEVAALMGKCGEAGVKAAVIISAGGKETGPGGAEIEMDIRAQADKYGIRIVGPNCLGVVRTANSLNASFASRMPLRGKMAFLSQSGAICTAILDMASKEGFGFSYFVSLGSMLDVDFADMINYLGGEPDVSSIVMYIESLSRLRQFMSAARAVSKVKPIIALKAGRTGAGARAAASHTGALAGQDRVYDAAFERAGIVRVKTFEELFDCAELLAKQPKPAGPRLVIVTNAGGPGVMAADALSDYGIEPVELSRKTLDDLNAILPANWSHNNPIDLLGDASPLLYRRVAEICLQADQADGLLLMAAPQSVTDPGELAKAVADLLKDRPFPVFTCWLGGADMDAGRRVFNRAGIPTFESPERSVRAFMDLYRYKQRIDLSQEIPAQVNRRLAFDRTGARAVIERNLAGKRGLLPEKEAAALLDAYGIPIVRTETARSPEEAVTLANNIGYPVAVKICSADISHKTDIGGVVLNLESGEKVRSAFATVVDNARTRCPGARIDGATLQPMVSDVSYELIAGIKKDRDFGPVLLFGLGGILTEIVNDCAMSLPPLNRLLARRLIESTRIARVLRGYRNLAPVDMAALEDVLIGLSQLAVDFAEIAELDINPLAVGKERMLALDARVILGPAEIAAPMHMVIAPYPGDQETHIRTAMGVDIFIRPIRPEDAGPLNDLFESLSPRSVYLRFFTPLKRLPRHMLARFTQIDYDREIALVAVPGADPDSEMLGVARVIRERTPQKAEFSVVVQDAWQGKGIGAALLKQCLKIARSRGVIEVWGTVLAENTQMLALGRSLGFKLSRDPGVGEYELRIDLSRKNPAF